MYKLSLKYLIAGIIVFALLTYLSTCITAKLRYLMFFMVLLISLANYLIKEGFNKEHQLYNKLLQKSRGDRKLVERLIEYERRRRPNCSRTELLEVAIYHWERDRR